MTARNKPEYFDYVSIARDAGISEKDLQAIEERTRADYPGDQMMFELRMLRTCRAIAGGRATVKDALRPGDSETFAA